MDNDKAISPYNGYDDGGTAPGYEKRHSIQEGVWTGDHGADCELQRRLSTRHITMIALGSSIGMGLWLGSGSSLSSAGPASLFIGYLLAGSMIWCVSHCIGEMACLYPLPSAFTQWSGKFVDPAAAFALGWAYWFSYIVTIANELAGATSVIQFWTSAVPIAAWITIFWVIIVLINIGAVNFFGEIEVVASSIKFGWIFIVIITMSVISAGYGNQGHIGWQYWSSTPFISGFKGFLSVMPTCVFAMSGSENCGLVAAETANPRKSVPRAVGSIWLRLSLFYLLGALMVTICVSPTDPDLFGAAGASETAASPFVIAYREAGWAPLAHLMNAIILISVVSTGSISGYGASRTTVGLAALRMAPSIMAKADKKGRPWYGLVPVFIIGGGLAYLNVDSTGSTVFGWFSNLVSLFTLFGWGMICLSNIRMRLAWKKQGRSFDELPWKSWTYPVGAWWGLILCILLIIAQFYLAVWPLDDDPKPTGSAENFFANYISVILILVMWIGAKIYYMTKGHAGWWVDLSTVDLDDGRRFYKVDDHIEKRPTGALGKAKKVLGFIFN